MPGIRLLFFMSFCLCFSPIIFSHPHAFIDASFVFVFDQNGLKEIRSKWLHDYQTGAVLIADFDKNGDGALSPEEAESLALDMFKNLGEYNFFTQLELESGVLEINPSPENIHASLHEGNLVFEFVIPCALAAEQESYKIVQIAQYDPEYFIDFNYVGSPKLVDANDFDYAISTVLSEKDMGYGWKVSVEKIVLRFCRDEGLKEPLSPEFERAQKGFLSTFYDDFSNGQKKLREQIEGLLQKNKDGKMSFLNLALLCFLVFFYGILHAAGPGHGKVLIASWLSGRNYRLVAGVLLGFLQAFFHGLSGVLVVLAGRYLLEHSGMRLLGDSGESLKSLSFSLIMGLGLFILLRELSSFLNRTAKRDNLESEKSVDNQKVVVDERGSKGREGVFFALAAGLVPCPGAIMIMLFCSAIKRTELGIILTIFFTIGMGLTISMTAVAVILARKAALPLSAHGEAIERILHLCSGVLLLSLGAFFQFFSP